MQHMRSAAVPDGEYTAAGTAVLDLIGLHGEHQSVLRVDRDREDVHPGNVEHGIGLGAPPRTEPHVSWSIVGAFDRKLGRL